MEFVGWGEYNEEGDEDFEFRRAENHYERVSDGMLVIAMDAHGTPLEGMPMIADIGGPGFTNVQGQKQLSGIISTTDCCKYGSEATLVRVYQQLTWIKSTAQQMLIEEGIIKIESEENTSMELQGIVEIIIFTLAIIMI